MRKAGRRELANAPVDRASRFVVDERERLVRLRLGAVNATLLWSWSKHISCLYLPTYCSLSSRDTKAWGNPHNLNIGEQLFTSPSFSLVAGSMSGAPTENI